MVYCLINPCQVHIILLIACHMRSVLFSCDIMSEQISQVPCGWSWHVEQTADFESKVLSNDKIETRSFRPLLMESLLINGLFPSLNCFWQIHTFKNELQARGALPRSRRTCSLVLFFFLHPWVLRCCSHKRILLLQVETKQTPLIVAKVYFQSNTSFEIYFILYWNSASLESAPDMSPNQAGSKPRSLLKIVLLLAHICHLHLPKHGLMGIRRH